MAIGDSRPLRANTLNSSLPRHHFVTCTSNCGYKGQRTADTPTGATSKPCPRCGSAVRVTPRTATYNRTGFIR